MMKVWVKTPNGYEFEINGHEMESLVSKNWLDMEAGDIAQIVWERIGLPVRVEETIIYCVGEFR